MINPKPIDVEKAIKEVDESWVRIYNERENESLEISRSQIEEYIWGWVFELYDPRKPNELTHVQYVFNKLNGQSMPVGTKGVSFAYRTILEDQKKRNSGIEEGQP